MKKFILVLVGVLSSNYSWAKLSSTSIEKQASNIKAVIATCKFDKKVLNDVKSKSVGSTITSGIATAASGTGAALSTVAAIKAGKMIKEGFDGEQKKDVSVSTGNSAAEGASDTKKIKDNKISEDNVKTLKNLRVGSTIASGIATGANLASVALNGSSVKELAELMDVIENCNTALNLVEISE